MKNHCTKFFPTCPEIWNVQVQEFGIYLLTLEYLIAEHARLILKTFSTLLALNRSCSLNYFGVFVQPARLLGPALLLYFLKSCLNFNLETILIDRVNMAKKSKTYQYVPLAEILYQNTCIWFFELMLTVWA